MRGKEGPSSQGSVIKGWAKKVMWCHGHYRAIANWLELFHSAMAPGLESVYGGPESVSWAEKLQKGREHST